MLLKLQQDGVVIGWANATGQDELNLKDVGYVESSEEERQSIIAKKHAKLEESNETPNGKPKGKPGRKPKNNTEGLGNGNGSDNNK